MDTGLTTLLEADIEKHRALAQSFITRIVVLEDSSARGGGSLQAPAAASCRPFRPAPCAERARWNSPGPFRRCVPTTNCFARQHTLLYRARRGLSVAMAVADVFAKSTALEDLQANARSPLGGEDVAVYKRLLSAAAYVAALPLPPICCRRSKVMRGAE